MNLIKTKGELLNYLDKIGYNKTNYRIAVEGLIFTKEGKILLEKRGPECRDEIGKLEGVGGSLGNHYNLLSKLQEEFNQELAAEVVGLEINIDRLLEVRQVQFFEAEKGWQDWIVVSHLCRIERGEPAIGEPGKIESLHELTLDELFAMDEADLSNSTIAARETYQEMYGNVPFYEA